MAEDTSCFCGGSEHPELLRYLLAGAENGLHILPSRSGNAAGALQRTHEGAGAEVIHEIILIQSGLEAHSRLRDVAENDGNVRAVAKEAYPRKILAPGEELRIHEIHLFIIEEVHGAFGIFPFINDSGIHQVEEIHGGFYFLDGFILALAIRATLGATQILKAGAGNEQQPRFGFGGFK